MAIGTTAAILGSAAIGAAGSIIGGRSAGRAADRAADSQVAVARENNALAREFRDENTANFAPWLSSGGRANALVDSFLFGPQQAQQPATGGGIPAGGATMTLARPSGGFNPRLTSGNGILRAAFQNGPLDIRVSQTGQPNRVATQGNVTANAMNGYDAFTNSPYYQFPLQEGLRSINEGYAANGTLQSGDAMKAINRFGQDYASGRMGEFIGLAERQSDRGIQGAGAIAGVGTNALASMSANNQNAANALSNAAIARGNANAGMWSGIGSALGGAFGALGGSSYGQYGAYPPYGAIGM